MRCGSEQAIMARPILVGYASVLHGDKKNSDPFRRTKQSLGAHDTNVLAGPTFTGISARYLLQNSVQMERNHPEEKPISET